jgi:uncharacterized protein (DUF1697 family)
VVLLRGINVGRGNRIAMPSLREALTGAGFDGVRTYVQSGNIVLDADRDAEAVADGVHELIAERFGLDIPVVVRSREELERVVARNPIPEGTELPKLYQVAFLDRAPDPETVQRLAELATVSERLVAEGRELYSFHPDGIARSKLAARIAARSLGVLATARNWTTVTTLLEMAAA